MLYACDHTWWRMHFAEVAQCFTGELWTVSESARELFDLNWIYGTDAAGLSATREYIHTGRNSGYQALGLAHLWGASRVILLGYDYQVGPAREVHWHGLHPRGLSNSGPGRFASWVKLMNTLAADIAKTQCRVLNSSRSTALSCFPRVALESALYEP